MFISIHLSLLDLTNYHRFENTSPTTTLFKTLSWRLISSTADSASPFARWSPVGDACGLQSTPGTKFQLITINLSAITGLSRPLIRITLRYPVSRMAAASAGAPAPERDRSPYAPNPKLSTARQSCGAPRAPRNAPRPQPCA